MSTFDFDEVIEHYHRAADEFVKGNPEPYQMVFSHREDVTLANPFGPTVHGWERVAATMERAASLYRDGEKVGFENIAKYVTPELAYIVELDHTKARVGGRQDVAPFALRVTTIFRPEDGTWKVVHRHADPITTARPAESVLQQ
jgi:ketosteroid isomerase-like protein